MSESIDLLDRIPNILFIGTLMSALAARPNEDGEQVDRSKHRQARSYKALTESRNEHGREPGAGENQAAQSNPGRAIARHCEKRNQKYPKQLGRDDHPKGRKPVRLQTGAGHRWHKGKQRQKDDSGYRRFAAHKLAPDGREGRRHMRSKV